MSSGGEPHVFSDEVFARGFPLHRACRDGDVGSLVSLLQHFADRVHLNVEDSCYGWTPIHWATHFGQLECVVRLVQVGCEVNRTTSRFKQTPTHVAAFAGHSHCVEWLTQAGADINKQDFLGEAPIHKAARSGSLDCIQALLLAGAKPSLRNNSGQTPADLAQAHGFDDCFHVITSKSQLCGSENGVNGVNGVQIGNGAPCGQHQHSRKRLLTAMDTESMKKARRVETDVLEQMPNSGGEEVEMSMSVESAQEDNSDAAKATPNGLHHTLPYADHKLPLRPSSPAPEAAAASCRPFADTCGSLHVTGSPGSCVLHRPAWWGTDCGDFLLYGHYHGFGDTAEELSYSSHLEHSSSIQAEHRYKQAVAGSIHLYHGS